MAERGRWMVALSLISALVLAGDVIAAATHSGGSHHQSALAASSSTTTSTTAPPETSTTASSTVPGTSTTTSTSTTSTTTIAPNRLPARWIYVASDSFDVIDVPTGKISRPVASVNLLAVSPDRTKVAVNLDNQAGDDSQGNSVFVAQSGVANPPVRLSDPSQDRTEFALTWSPDGTKVAYGSHVAGASGGTGEEVVVANADGTGRRQVTTGSSLRVDAPASNLVWSPDGSTIAFISDEAGPMASVKTVSVATGTIATVAVDASGLFNLAYLPTGHLLANEAGGGVVEIAADGSSLRRVTPAGQTAFGFALSPDGKTVAYNTAAQLETIGVSGGQPRSYATANPAFVPPVWSADGSALLVSNAGGSAPGTYVVRLADKSITSVHSGPDRASWW